MMKKKKILNIKTGIISTMITGLVIGIMILSNTISPEIIVEETYIRSWHTVFEGALADGMEASPDGGILQIFFINHTETPTTTYSNNSSQKYQDWCNTSGLGYASADDFRTEIDHSTLFDVLLRVNGNKTMCWNGTAFIGSYLRVNFTSPHLGIAALTGMIGVESQNNTGLEYLWMNFYLNNSGAGYSIIRGNESKLPTIRYQAYY